MGAGPYSVETAVPRSNSFLDGMFSGYKSVLQYSDVQLS